MVNHKLICLINQYLCELSIIFMINTEDVVTEPVAAKDDNVSVITQESHQVSVCTTLNYPEFCLLSLMLLFCLSKCFVCNQADVQVLCV